MKAAIVNIKEIVNKRKNPTLSLSAKDILRNKMIVKEPVQVKARQGDKPKYKS